MYLLWEKSHQKGLKVAKYCAKVTLVCVRRGSRWHIVIYTAAGGYCFSPPQINQRMGKAGNFLWECRQFLSTQNEQYETRRARGDFLLVNRSRMVSLSRADKKKSDNSNKNKNVSPNILGQPFIYARPPR